VGIRAEYKLNKTPLTKIKFFAIFYIKILYMNICKIEQQRQPQTENPSATRL
jgi:hypothetical protein